MKRNGRTWLIFIWRCSVGTLACKRLEQTVQWLGFFKGDILTHWTQVNPQPTCCSALDPLIINQGVNSRSIQHLGASLCKEVGIVSVYLYLRHIQLYSMYVDVWYLQNAMRKYCIDRLFYPSCIRISSAAIICYLTFFVLNIKLMVINLRFCNNYSLYNSRQQIMFLQLFFNMYIYKKKYLLKS